jgi:hypothetical protein
MSTVNTNMAPSEHTAYNEEVDRPRRRRISHTLYTSSRQYQGISRQPYARPNVRRAAAGSTRSVLEDIRSMGLGFERSHTDREPSTVEIRVTYAGSVAD